jgi:hypothetical protein
MTTYPFDTTESLRGSTWRKWDLHIHTPASFHWNGTKRLKEMNDTEKSQEIRTFIDNINASDVAVFCIMDYWTFDWYLELLDFQEKNPGLLHKTIFPGMELRIECPVDYRLNIHCILSDKLTRQELVDFKSELYILSIDKKLSDDALIKFGKSLDASKAKVHGFDDPNIIPDDELLQLGSKTAVVTKESLKKALSQIPTEMGFIILPYDTSDGLLRLNWKEHPHDDNYFMQSADIFESRDQRNIDLINGKRTSDNEEFFDNFFKTLGNKPKPCISGSDAHKYSDYGNYPSDRITWIKADPTFEGLKQIIYEPTERIKIQKLNPDTDFDKPQFASVQIIEETKVLHDTDSNLKFSISNIPLNRGLVSIIGGRGQGKSMLINYLGYGLSKEIEPKLQKKISLNDNYQIEWKQGTETTIKSYSLGTQKNLPFTFIYQSKVKEISDDIEVLKKEVIDILNGAGFQKPNSKIDEIQIKETLQKYWNLKEWLEKTDENGNPINDKNAIKKKIDEIKGNINLITDGSNKLLLEEFVLNIEIINQKKEDNIRLRKLRQTILNFKESINTELLGFDSSIPQIDTTPQQRQIWILYRRNFEEIIKQENSNKKIKDENFKDYKGDLSQLLLNLTNYQRDITVLEESVKSIEESFKDFLLTKDKLNAILIDQLNTLIEEQKAITDTWTNKIFNNPERKEPENDLIKKILIDKHINIEGVIFLNVNSFFSEAEKFIDGRALKPKTKEKMFELLDLDILSLSNSILNYSIEKLEKIREENSSCFYVGNEYDIFKIFVDPSIKNKYIQVIPKITVEGKNLNELSAGQKGTFYLCLKLATQLFSGPIIFDQPEDDLDNDFITNHLIDLFKDIKKYRQVIIVSHNANLVVNADSEQVIIANNNQESLSYSSGSLENVNINSDICRILEGGHLAFEKRRNKYRYNK